MDKSRKTHTLQKWWRSVVGLSYFSGLGMRWWKGEEGMEAASVHREWKESKRGSICFCICAWQGRVRTFEFVTARPTESTINGRLFILYFLIRLFQRLHVERGWTRALVIGGRFFSLWKMLFHIHVIQFSWIKLCK